MSRTVRYLLFFKKKKKRKKNPKLGNSTKQSMTQDVQQRQRQNNEPKNEKAHHVLTIDTNNLKFTRVLVPIQFSQLKVGILNSVIMRLPADHNLLSFVT